jgi:5'-nucleotidase / UDP-sugar diphosphatase
VLAKIAIPFTSSSQPKKPMLLRLAAALIVSALFVAQAVAARLTFVLVNDIYQMSEQAGADGKMRGGFARLATVVKTERARGNPVIFAHGGDTLSPSLMSGLDRGAHIMALTNMVRPDIFVPGNHEFDFGKTVFFQRMAEAKFPLYAANLRGPDGQSLPGFKDSAIVTLNGIKVGLIGATYDGSPRASTTEDLKFLPTIATVKDHAEALRRDGGCRADRHPCHRPAADRARARPHHQLRRNQRACGVELRRAVRRRDRHRH